MGRITPRLKMGGSPAASAGRESAPPARRAGGVLVVFYHPRLEEIRARVIELGGKISADIFSFPGGLRFHFLEPSGNECAIWSEERKA